MFNVKSAVTVGKFMGRPVKAGDVGIEIEIEGNLMDVAVKGWVTHREDSLRNGGAEFVTVGPVAMENVFKQVFNLNDAITKSRCRYNLKSHLGSTHVHVNMLGENFDTVFGTAILWTCIEPIIMRLCGPMRDGNLFCLPSYDSGDTQAFFEQLCKYIDTGGHAGRWTHGKYSALNFNRLLDFGTLEFRGFPTSIDPHEVQKWCKWVTNLRRLARGAHDKSFKDAVRHAEQHPEAFVSSVLGDTVGLARGLAPDTIGGLVDFGAAQAYELARIVARYRNAPVKEAPKEDLWIVDDIAPRPKAVFGWKIAIAKAAARDAEAAAARLAARPKRGRRD